MSIGEIKKRIEGTDSDVLPSCPWRSARSAWIGFV